MLVKVHLLQNLLTRHTQTHRTKHSIWTNKVVGNNGTTKWKMVCLSVSSKDWKIWNVKISLFLKHSWGHEDYKGPHMTIKMPLYSNLSSTGLTADGWFSCFNKTLACEKQMETHSTMLMSNICVVGHTQWHKIHIINWQQTSFKFYSASVKHQHSSIHGYSKLRFKVP